MHWPLRTGKRLPDNLLLQEMTALHALLIVQAWSKLQSGLYPQSNARGFGRNSGDDIQPPVCFSVS